MKLRKLELTNFQQFYGYQEIEFADGSATGRNVTVFHGFNGAGKTALLNSFIWCLYGELTPDLGDKHRLVNERAFAESAFGNTVDCQVALTFEYRGETWRVVRSANVTKTGNSNSPATAPLLQLGKTTVVGEFETVGREEVSRQHRIDQMLPKSLYQFFFFNGERMEALAREDAYSNVEAGVKTLLDIEVYERGARHLKEGVRKALTEDVRKAGDQDLAAANEQLGQQEDEKTKLEEAIREQRRQISFRQDEIGDLERRQQLIREAAEYARQRKQLRNERDTLKDDIQVASKSLANTLSKGGYLAFGELAFTTTEKLVDAARKRGDLPAKIKPRFVDDLIEENRCICGRPVHPNSHEYDELMRYKSTTGLAELEERIGAVSQAVKNSRKRRQETYKEIDALQARITDLRTKLRTCEGEISAIDEKLADGEAGDEAARISAQIKQLREEIGREYGRIEANEEKIKRCELSIADLKQKTEKMKAQGEVAQKAQRRIQMVDNVVAAFNTIRDIQKEDVRQALDHQVRELWTDAAIKAYEASVSAKYELLLTKRVEGQNQPVLGASTGEKQVLALSFVGAMVRKARENAEKAAQDETMEGMSSGGYYPLVMDSPFGSLEDEYRSKVATWLPNLANQIVVMASKSQWRHEVENAMRSRIGKEYILELHTTKQGADRSIALAGQEYPYVVCAPEEVEKTIIREVK